jgi:hypothetical protein
MASSPRFQGRARQPLVDYGEQSCRKTPRRSAIAPSGCLKRANVSYLETVRSSKTVPTKAIAMGLYCGPECALWTGSSSPRRTRLNVSRIHAPWAAIRSAPPSRAATTARTHNGFVRRWFDRDTFRPLDCGRRREPSITAPDYSRQSGLTVPCANWSHAPGSRLVRA